MMNKHGDQNRFNLASDLIQLTVIRSDNPTACPIQTRPSCLQFALLMALGQVALVPSVWAQIVADPHAPGSQQPTVLAAGNGVPLVNIQTPSAAGVSRNAYQQFDVNTSGAILNNANTNVQTQLGGWVQGNPWLAQNTARVILNEVNASDPSQLQGHVEIAGQRAELVIANPAGITCNGCGFINAERATITTGTPIIHNGHLEGYRVHGGNIAISGTGMDASAPDYTALIARSVAVNADLWAQELQVIGGTNEVSADHATAQPISADNNIPTFALDVSALGGMYAQKIALIGTEHGVGVRNAGIIGAQAGELMVTSEGRLENSGELHARTHTQLAANEIINTGIISANQTLSAQANQTIDNRNGQLFSASTLDLQAKNLTNSGGLLYAEKILNAHINDTLNNQNGLILSDQEIKIESRNIINRDTAHQTLGIQGEKVQLSAYYIDNIYGTIAADKATHIVNTQQLDNNHGQISSAEDISILAQTIQNDYGTLLAENLLYINSENLSGNGKLLSRRDINLILQQDFVNTGEIIANGRAELRTLNALDNHGLVQVGDLQIHSKQIHNAENGIIHGNRNNVITDNMLENRGIIDGSVTYVKANTLNNVGPGRIYGDRLAIAADNLTYITMKKIINPL